MKLLRLYLPEVPHGFDESRLYGYQFPVDGSLIVSQEGILDLKLNSDLGKLLEDLCEDFVEVQLLLELEVKRFENVL